MILIDFDNYKDAPVLNLRLQVTNFVQYYWKYEQKWITERYNQ